MLLLTGCPAAQHDDQAPARTGAQAAPEAAAAKPPAATRKLTVWADPLLEVPLTALKADFTAKCGGSYDLLFVERGELLDQAKTAQAETALPDIFITADGRTLRALLAAGLVDEPTARTFAGDSLALVQLAGGRFVSGTLFDVYKMRFDHLAVGTESTAVGFYTHQALVTEGCFPRLEDRLLTFDRTADLLDSLTSGQSMIGIITKSQFVQSQGLDLMLLISERLHEDIRYQAVAARGRGSNDSVMALLRFLAEDEQVQLKLQGYGLSDRQTALIEDK